MIKPNIARAGAILCGIVILCLSAAESRGADMARIAATVLQELPGPSPETTTQVSPPERDGAGTLAQELSEALAQSEPVQQGVAEVRAGGAAEQTVRVPWWLRVAQPGLTWFAVCVILLLTVQLKPVLSLRNGDGLVLALCCLLLSLRLDTGMLPDGFGGQTLQWWSYLLLSLAAVYWLFRGGWLLMSPTVTSGGCNVSSGAMLILVVVGLVLGAVAIGAAPLSEGSRDGLVGGVYTAQHGTLPYGDTYGHDGRSPLLYLVHAGALHVCGTPAELDWRTYSRYDARGAVASTSTEMVAVQLVNRLLFVLTLGGLYVLGRGLHSASLGLTVVVILCVFPGTRECLPRPEIMLPTLLLTWSVAFVFLRGLGGLVATLCLVLAGLAWPWAWLGLPILLAYFLRQGWHALGSVAGLAGGAAVCLVGLTWLAEPNAPRADGALAAAGLQPAYAGRQVAEGTLVLDPWVSETTLEPDFKSWLWRPLVESESADLSNLGMSGQRIAVAPPNGVDAGAIMYRSIAAPDSVWAKLRPGYRAALADLPLRARVCSAIRTVLEATWLPAVRSVPPGRGAWECWASPQNAERWTLIRRIAKLTTALLAVVVAVQVYFWNRTRPHQLVGALLAVCSAALLASEMGAVTNLAWLLPLALGAMVATTGVPPGAGDRVSESKGESIFFGPAPRITVEK
ncbi:MAG: hypothetical protein KKB50_07185 [Planctomycetes bacterium]|nr:hypothetical protein [Planctomycetota bacterium]